ncbi:MAG: hypothetical protein NTV43_10880 [Methylococcales bacterium]|nr:hypothetical protein [Methylococcales bacterium]
MKLISESNGYLSDAYKPFNDFDLFDEDDVPHNSDVVFILSQYLQCFEKLRSDNIVKGLSAWYWQVKGGDEDNVDKNGMVKIKTVKPKRFKE